MILDTPRSPAPPKPSLVPLCVLLLLLLGYVAVNFPKLPSAQEQRNRHLADAVRARDTSAAAQLIAEGADPNTRSFGVSLPAIAAAQDDVAILSLLQAHGADLNARSLGTGWNPNSYRGRLPSDDTDDSFWILASYRTTPLMEAVLHDNLDAARFLLDHGASLHAVSETGATMLILAVHASRPAVVHLLLQKGAEVNAETLDGSTALMTAASRGRPDLLRQLIAAGAKVNVQDRRGNTPLSAAILSNNVGAVQILLTHGVMIAPGTTLQALLPSQYISAPGARQAATLKNLTAEVHPEMVRLLAAHGAISASRPLFHFPPSIAPQGPYVNPHSKFVAETLDAGKPILARAGRLGGAAFAVRLHSSSGILGRLGGTLWVSSSQILDEVYLQKFVLRNVWTGKETPLLALTAAWNRQRSGNELGLASMETLERSLCLSPDKRWLLGKTNRGWFATTLQGTQPHLWPSEAIGILTYSAWLPDDRRWILADFAAATLTVHSLDNPQVLKYPLQFRNDLGSPVVLDSFGHPITIQMTQIATLDGLADAAPKPGTPLRIDHFQLVPAGSAWTIRRTTFFLYPKRPGEIFQDCVWSPQGDQVAWTVWAPEGDRYYVSRADGHEMRLVFDLPHWWTNNNLGWMPDGKSLCFDCGGWLYQVPA